MSASANSLALHLSWLCISVIFALKLVTGNGRSVLQMERVDAKIAGYMELPGAQKDGDCVRVKVTGGISHKLGCCNLFEWEKRGPAKLFSCGTCEYVRDRAR